MTITRRFRERPVSIVVGLAPLIVLWMGVATHQWFVADEWEFIVGRDRPPLSEPGAMARMLLRPHNEHWNTIPIIVFRAVFGVVGLKAYWPYLVVLLAAHALVLGLLVRRLRLDGCHGWVAASLIAILGLHGAGAENLLWAFQLAFVLPVALGLLALELEERAAHRWCWAAGLGAIMCSGVGIAMVAAVGGATLLRSGWRAALRAVSVPAVVYALWFVTYGREGTVNTHADWSTAPFQAIPYAWRSLTVGFDRTVGLDGIGPIVIVALVAAIVGWWPWLRATHPAELGLALGDIAFLMLVALGREALGDPGAGRYAYINLALLTPIVGVVLTRVLRLIPHAGRVAFAVIGVVSLGVSSSVLADEADRTGRLERRVRDHVSAGFVVARSPFAAGNAIVDADSPDLTIDGIRRLAARGDIPWGQPTEQAIAELLARTSADVTARPSFPIASEAFQIVAVARATVEAVESGCVRLTPTAAEPQIVLLPHRPGSIKVVPYVDGAVVTAVRTERRVANAASTKVVANNPVFVNFLNPRTQYVLTVPVGSTTTLCGTGQALPKA